MRVHDLNSKSNVCDHSGFEEIGVRHERGQNTVCASDGVCAVENIRAHHQQAQRRLWRAHFGVCRFVPRHGVRTTDAEQIGTPQSAHARVAVVPVDDAPECFPRHILHHLRKQCFAHVHVSPRFLRNRNDRKHSTWNSNHGHA